MDSTEPTDHGDWVALSLRLKDDPHVIEVASRVWETEKFIAGARDAMTLDRVIHEIAQSVAMWKTTKPPHKMIYGYFLVSEGPHDGWSVYVRAGNIYDVHLSTFWDEARARQAERDAREDEG